MRTSSSMYGDDDKMDIASEAEYLLQLEEDDVPQNDAEFPNAVHPRLGKRDGDGFDPSIKLLSRIMKIILENNSIGRTALAQKANINYYRLRRHLAWLQKKSFVELFIDDGRINVRLNTLGTEFAYRLSSLTDDQKFGLE